MALFLDLAVLFEKLIEQHRVHSFVADGVDVALGVMGHQIRIYLCDLLGDEPELRDAGLIQFGLVVESDRTQGEQRVTGRSHFGDVCLEATCGEKDAKLASVVHVTGAPTCPNGLTCDAPDVAAITNVRTCGADTDNVIGRGDVDTGCITQGRVVGAAGVAKERVNTAGRVEGAVYVVKERVNTAGRVGHSRGVAEKRSHASGRIFV